MRGRWSEGTELMGHVFQVRVEDVLLRFSEGFHENFDNEDYDVMFTFNRWAWQISVLL